VKINPITTVPSVQLSNMGGTNEARAEKPKVNQPPEQNAVVASVRSPSPLSEETKKSLTFAMQEIALNSEHTHKVSPAQQARAAIADHPELADLAFGHIVSAVARGEPLPTVTSESQHDEDSTLDPLLDEPTPHPMIESPVADDLSTADHLIPNVPTNPVTDEVLWAPLDPPSEGLS
jgi:hypothetical protein